MEGQSASISMTSKRSRRVLQAVAAVRDDVSDARVGEEGGQRRRGLALSPQALEQTQVGPADLEHGDPLRGGARQPTAHAVSPDPRPMIATSRGAGWTMAGIAPRTVCIPPKGSVLKLLPLIQTSQRSPLGESRHAGRVLVDQGRLAGGAVQAGPEPSPSGRPKTARPEAAASGRKADRQP